MRKRKAKPKKRKSRLVPPPPWKPKKSFLQLCARSKRLELRPLTLKDYSAWYSGYSGRAPGKSRFDPGRPQDKELTPSAFRKRVARQRFWASSREGFIFQIFDRKTGAILGFVGFFVISARNRWANLGYEIHNQHGGKGYASEAAQLCLEIGFGDLDFHRIEASCPTDHKASAKVAKNAGLISEGMRKKFFPQEGGVNMLIFAQNQIDWKGGRR